MTVVEQPLAVEDVTLEQSLATCPPLLQKRHDSGRNGIGVPAGSACCLF